MAYSRLYVILSPTLLGRSQEHSLLACWQTAASKSWSNPAPKSASLLSKGTLVSVLHLLSREVILLSPSLVCKTWGMEVLSQTSLTSCVTQLTLSLKGVLYLHSPLLHLSLIRCRKWLYIWLPVGSESPPSFAGTPRLVIDIWKNLQWRQSYPQSFKKS